MNRRGTAADEPPPTRPAVIAAPVVTHFGGHPALYAPAGALALPGAVPVRRIRSVPCDHGTPISAGVPTRAPSGSHAGPRWQTGEGRSRAARWGTSAPALRPREGTDRVSRGPVR